MRGSSLSGGEARLRLKTLPPTRRRRDARPRRRRTDSRVGHRPRKMAEQRNVSYDDTSSGCMTLLDGDGDQTSWLGCVMGCMERPPEDENERKPSQAAGDLLARAETEERRGAYGAASELYRRALYIQSCSSYPVGPFSGSLTIPLQ